MAGIMKHYFHPMSRAVSTYWMLEELGVAYEQVVVDFMAGENDTAEFRQINPMGKIPALVDGDVVVTETAAICAYLADKYADKGLAPPISSNERGRYYRYLFFPGVSLEPMFVFEQLDTGNIQPQSAGWGDIERCLATVEALVPETEWAMGEKFSAADVVFGGMLDFAVQFGWLQSPSTKVANYVRRLKDRDAYKKTHDPSWH